MAKLVALAGADQGKTWIIGRELSIGRSNNNQLQIEDLALSRQHCAIREEDGLFRLEDQQSSNGTFVNGQPVTSRVLGHGDQIRAGHCLFVFLADEMEPAPEPACVAMDEGQIVVGSTLVLRPGDSPYADPGKVAFKVGQQALRDLETLLRISFAIRKVSDLDALKVEVLASIGEVIPADRAAILLIDDSGEEILSLKEWRTQSFGGPMIVSRTVIGRVLKEKVCLLSNDVTHDSDLESAGSLLISKVKALIAVPLTIFQRVLGVIYVESRNPQTQYDEHHLELLTGIAGIAAAALDNALRIRDLESENTRLMAEVNVRHNMIGDGPAIRKVLQFIAKVAPTPATVLLRGESGTGKELVARAIHRNSPRASRPLIAVNCAALTETLLESELFGYERGAFTGAVAQKRGKLEEAEGGTILLDEVGELAPGIQAKLLRVLQEREFERVGGTRTIKVNIRLIAATNRDLEDAARHGTFRSDLYYRLNVVSLEIPPLRERREDIPLLASYFVQKHAAAVGRRVIGVSPEARGCLVRYSWPGNIRELENAIERAVVLGSTDKILVEDLPEGVVEAEGKHPTGSHFTDAVREAKKQIVLRAIGQAAGNHAEAARLLGLHPSNLHRLIRNLGMRPGSI